LHDGGLRTGRKRPLLCRTGFLPPQKLGYVLYLSSRRHAKIADCAGLPIRTAAASATTSKLKISPSNVFVRGNQPVCREPSEARVSSAFDLLSLFLLQDEAVEPYLQRDPYTFEVQERDMAGWAQVARRHGQGLLNHNSKIFRAFYVSRGLLPQNSNLTMGSFAPQFWGVLFSNPFF
jgi:hypothetical protein